MSNIYYLVIGVIGKIGKWVIVRLVVVNKLVKVVSCIGDVWFDW